MPDPTWSTPRDSVADVSNFTAAWYNAEVRDDLKWLYNVLTSRGASFPASPVAGQAHTFVSGFVQARFVYDGSHWLSDPVTMPILNHQDFSILFGNPYSQNVTATAAQALDPTRATLVNVDELISVGCVLQARLETVFTASASPGTTYHLGLSLAPIAALGGTPGTVANYTSTEVTATYASPGYKAGAWGDTISAAAVAVQLGLYGYISGSAGYDTMGIGHTNVSLRFKK